MSARSIRANMRFEPTPEYQRVHRVIALITVLAAALFAVGLGSVGSASPPKQEASAQIETIAEFCDPTRSGEASRIEQPNSCMTSARW